MAQAEEEGDHEPALFKVRVNAKPAPPLQSASPNPTLPHLHIDEPRAQVFLGTGSDNRKQIEGWYLDTSATNHMTERGDVFSDLDRVVAGTLKFGDGSVVDICGIGTIVFSDRNGEHKALGGVYYIPRLRNSIISIGQLVESGSRVEIKDGVLQIWDHQRRLLARVK